jgi:glycosyltransferase involved in cell wall biosynthesis
MNRRLKVLISAFACRPGKGSEPEVGWCWAIGMARYHDVTVLTQLKHRPGIEAGLAALPHDAPRPNFRYFDGGPKIARLRQRFGGVRIFYTWWQKVAWKVVAQLNDEIGFDLLHHITFAGYRYTTAVWGHGVPCIWGPVGGMESVPLRLMPLDNPLALVAELTRNLSNAIQSVPFHVLPRRAADSSIVLVSTRETQQVFEAVGVHPILMPTVGIDAKVISKRLITAPTGTLELLFVGQIISLKGVDLAIRALHASGTSARLTFIGSGSYQLKAAALARRLGIESKVLFPGRVPREQVLQEYEKYHVFLFPSLHDSGGFAVLEAMAQGLPVICLDCGGPAISVRDGCGIRIPMLGRKKVVEQMAGAIQTYDRDRARVAVDGQRARESVTEHYEWNRKYPEMDAVYTEATRENERLRAAARRKRFLMGSRHLVFTTRGILLSLLLILGISLLEIQSIRQLNGAATRIVSDTLPSLSSAAVANESRNNSFIKLQLLLHSASPAEEVKYVADIERLSNETTVAFKNYEDVISDQADRENFQKLMKARISYLAFRGLVIEELTSGRKKEALALFEQSLLPAFNQYAEISRTITTYNVEAGKKDGREILRLTAMSQIILASLGIAVFLTGFFLGVSKT